MFAMDLAFAMTRGFFVRYERRCKRKLIGRILFTLLNGLGVGGCNRLANTTHTRRTTPFAAFLHALSQT